MREVSHSTRKSYDISSPASDDAWTSLPLNKLKLKSYLKNNRSPTIEEYTKFERNLQRRRHNFGVLDALCSDQSSRNIGQEKVTERQQTEIANQLKICLVLINPKMRSNKIESLNAQTIPALTPPSPRLAPTQSRSERNDFFFSNSQLEFCDNRSTRRCSSSFYKLVVAIIIIIIIIISANY
jgi:hypothetical protein